MFRKLAIRYGWTIEEIGKLNAGQVEMMLVADQSDSKNIPFDTLEEAAAHQRRRRSADG